MQKELRASGDKGKSLGIGEGYAARESGHDLAFLRPMPFYYTPPVASCVVPVGGLTAHGIGSCALVSSTVEPVPALILLGLCRCRERVGALRGMRLMEGSVGVGGMTVPLLNTSQAAPLARAQPRS